MSSPKSDRLGTMPVGKLLISMSLPMMISFFIQALYNIVDSMFVAQISEDALTAVSLAFPMQQIMGAISIGIGVGLSATVSRHVGVKGLDGANRLVHTAIFMDLCVWLFFAVLGILVVKPLFAMQTDVTAISSQASVYLRICWCAGFGVFYGQLFEKLLVCNGFPTLAMAAQASGAVFNIIFDPLLIFGIGPFPRLGIAGAALATVLGQIFAAAVALILNIKRNTNITLDLKKIGFDSDAAGKVLKIGFPSMITLGLASLSSFSINQILLTYSTTATAVFGIWMKLQNFCYMPMFGMNNGSVPILSYNYAIKRNDRVKETIHYAMVISVVLMIVVCGILECIPDVILKMFNATDNLMQIGRTCLRICLVSLPFGALCIIMGSALQALGLSMYTLILNVGRQFVILIGCFFLLSVLTGRLELLWYAVPLTEWISFIMALVFYRKLQKILV